MSIAETLLTADEYERLPTGGRPTELVRGNLVELDMPGAQHGKTCHRISLFLGMYNETQDRGHVFTNDTSILTERGPDTVRGADVAFVGYDRLPKGNVPPGLLRVAPNLVFEVRSPTDRWTAILEKVTEYIRSGAEFVCVADPLREIVRVYTENDPDIELQGDDLLEFPTLLPGFSVPVRRLFE
jgi:Uma2 family endonuclease